MTGDLRQFPRSLGGDTGGSDDDLHVRLRAVEERLQDVALETREIKTNLAHTATRAWVLGGVLGGMVAAATIAAAVLRFFAE